MTDVSINTSGASPMWGVGGTDQAQKAQKLKNHGVIRDSVEMGTAQKTIVKYTQDVNRPALALPNQNGSDAKPAPKNSPPTYSSLYSEKFASHLDQLANQYGLSKDQVSLLIFKHNNPDQPIDDTFLEGLLSDMEAKVAEEMAQEYETPGQKEIVEQGKKHLKNLGKSLDKAEKNLKEAADALPEGEGKMNMLAFLKTLSQAKSKFKEVQKEIEESDHQTYADISRALHKQADDTLNLLKDWLKGGGDFKMITKWIAKHGEDAKPPFFMQGAYDRYGKGMTKEQAQGLLQVVKDLDGDGKKIKMEIARLESFVAGGVLVGIKDIGDVWFEFNPESGELAKPKAASASYNKQLTAAYGEAFEGSLDALAKKEGLTPEQIGKIRFAHYNPGMGDPSVEGMVKTVEQNALTELSKNYTLPKGFKPPVDSNGFNHEVSYQFSNGVEDALRAYGEENGLTGPQIESMIYLHYHTGADVPDSAALAPIVGKIETEVLAKIAGPNGLPADFKPTPSTVRSDAQLTGELGIIFEENLTKAGLTSAQTLAVRSALSSPTMRSAANPETEELIDQVFDKSVADLKTQKGLPAAWAPIGGLNALSGNPTTRVAIAQASEIIGSLRAEVDKMPPSDGKAVYTDILKQVSDALSSMRRLIGLMKGLDTEVAQKVSQAELDRELRKIEEKVAKMKEVEEMMKKVESLKGPGMQFVKIFFSIILVYFSGLLAGPLVTATQVAVTLADEALEATKEGSGLLTQAFKEIADAMPDTALGRLASFVTQFLTVIAMAGGTNYTVMLNLLFEKSTALKELAMSAGASEKQGDTFNMAMQIIVTIIETIVSTVATMGAGAGASAAKFAGQTAANSAKAATKAAANAAQAAQNAAGKVADEVIQAVKVTADAAEEAAKAAEKASKAVTQALRTGTGAADLSKGAKGLDNASEVAKKAADIGELATKAAEKADEAAKAANDAVRALQKAVKEGGGNLDDFTNLSTKAQNAANAGVKSGDDAARFAQEIEDAFEPLYRAADAKVDALSQTSPKLAKIQKLANQMGKKINQMAAEGSGFDKLEKATALLEGALNASSSLVEIPKNLTQAKVARKQGEIDAADAEAEAIIKMMQKLLKTLYAMLSGYTSWYEQVGNQQAKMWQDKSQVLSRLTQV